MPGRVPVIALWLVAVVALALAAAALVLAMNAGNASLATKAELDASVAEVERSVEGLDRKIGGLTAIGGSQPVVNAAMLDGVTAEQFVRSDAPISGHFNCQGIGMWPWSSATRYSQTRLGRVVTSGEGFFDCMVNLPDGATITALKARVHDLSPTEQAQCYMIAAPINLESPGSNPAYTESSGDSATPGDVIIEDLSIDPAIVDNANNSYLVECWLSGPGNLALVGVSVEYTLNGLAVP